LSSQLRSFDDDDAIRVLASEASRLQAAVECSSISAEVPFCPGWSVLDLAAHVAGVFRWVTEVVAGRRLEPPVGEERRALFADPDLADTAGVIKRLRSASEGVIGALTDSDQDLDCWTIWAPPGSPRQFWVRRMLFETLVHRVDAENALSQRASSGAEIDPHLAGHGLDEIVCGFARRYSATLRTDRELTMILRTTDVVGSWWSQIGTADPRFGRGEAPTSPSAEVRGAAGELLLLLWNRRAAADLEVIGDRSALEVWRHGAHL
jgi:uncharacterized protein (TIGR03083 family)